MPLNPDEFNEEEDARIERMFSWDEMEEIISRFNSHSDAAERWQPPSRPKVAWLHGDHEYYPVWSTTLYEQDQIWRTKYKLRTSEQRVERLAQEVALHVLINDIAHDS